MVLQQLEFKNFDLIKTNSGHKSSKIMINKQF